MTTRSLIVPVLILVSIFAAPVGVPDGSETVSLDRAPVAYAVTPPVYEAPNQWVVDPGRMWMEGGEVWDKCRPAWPHNGYPVGRVVMVVSIAGPPVDLSFIPTALDIHAPGATAAPPIFEPDITQIWNHGNENDTVLAVVPDSLVPGSMRGYGCEGRAIVSTHTLRDPCPWVVFLHELGHAWGLTHSGHGIMSHGYGGTCKDADNGFIPGLPEENR